MYNIHKWYFALSESSIDRHDHGWRGLIRVAVNSALQHTTLIPHMLYDGQENGFTDELQQAGVVLIHHRVSFYDALKQRERTHPGYLQVASGAFLRVEIPLIEKEDPYVLYTDCDVIFREGFSLPTLLPKLFAAAPQASQTDYADDMNSGIMILNLPAMKADLPEFIEFIIAGLQYNWPGADQENYRRFYKGKWDHLPLEFNWKPYWGQNSAAKIIHWHGPKPMLVRKLREAPDRDLYSEWRLLYERDRGAYDHWLTEWDKIADALPRTTLGHVDLIDANTIAGWAILEDGEEPVRFHVEIDGQIVGGVDCTIPRHDIAEKFGQPQSGFHFSIPAHAQHMGRHIVRLINQFGEVAHLYCEAGKTTTFEYDGHRLLREPALGETSIIAVVDSLSPHEVVGWAFDTARPESRLTLTLVIDGEDQPERLPCDRPREDVAAFDYPMHVGFEGTIPRHFFDNQTHTLQAKLDGVLAPFLIQDEKVGSFNFRSPWYPKAFSHIDGIDNGIVIGWVITEDASTGRRLGGAQLLVTDNDAFVTQLTADEPRPDVAATYGCAPDCGFVFTLPPADRRAGDHIFRFYLMPYRVEIDGSPISINLATDTE